MAIRNAKASMAVGFSLVDMLLSTALMALVLTTLMTVMISNTSAGQKEIGQLILYNRVSETLRLIQDELRRASHIDTSSSPLTQLSYFYRVGEWRLRTIVKADLNEHKLKYCSEAVTQLTSGIGCSRFYSMFDSNQIRLIDFTVNVVKSDQDVAPPLVSISLTADLVNKTASLQSHEPLTLTVRLAPRN